MWFVWEAHQFNIWNNLVLLLDQSPSVLDIVKQNTGIKWNKTEVGEEKVELLRGTNRNDVCRIQEVRQQVKQQDDSCCGKIKDRGMNENETKMATETWVREGISREEWRELTEIRQKFHEENKYDGSDPEDAVFLFIYLLTVISLHSNSRLIAPLLRLFFTSLYSSA